jgi:hypothetical protein
VTARRFPPPWSVEEQNACFVVRDHNGQFAYLSDLMKRQSSIVALVRAPFGHVARLFCIICGGDGGCGWGQRTMLKTACRAESSLR